MVRPYPLNTKCRRSGGGRCKFLSKALSLTTAVGKVKAMTLDKAREMLTVHVDLAGGYNRNAVRLILGEVQRAHGGEAVDRLIGEFNLEQVFGIRPGSRFSGF